MEDRSDDSDTEEYKERAKRNELQPIEEFKRLLVNHQWEAAIDCFDKHTAEIDKASPRRKADLLGRMFGRRFTRSNDAFGPWECNMTLLNKMLKLRAQVPVFELGFQFSDHLFSDDDGEDENEASIDLKRAVLYQLYVQMRHVGLRPSHMRGFYTGPGGVLYDDYVRNNKGNFAPYDCYFPLDILDEPMTPQLMSLFLLIHDVFKLHLRSDLVDLDDDDLFVRLAEHRNGLEYLKVFEEKNEIDWLVPIVYPDRMFSDDRNQRVQTRMEYVTNITKKHPEPTKPFKRLHELMMDHFTREMAHYDALGQMEAFREVVNRNGVGLQQKDFPKEVQNLVATYLEPKPYKRE